jgi:hypothetical protein
MASCAACPAHLFLDRAAYFSKVFPEGIIGIGFSLFQVLRKLQLFPERISALDLLRLAPFPFPDFVRHAKQFVDTLRIGKQTAVVVGKHDIVSFDHEVAEPRGAQR